MASHDYILNFRVQVALVKVSGFALSSYASAFFFVYCTSVQSTSSLQTVTHPSARDDAWSSTSQVAELGRGRLDGLERLAMECLLERQKWLNLLWCVA